MKLIYTILFFIALQANATTYYVRNAGNDANSGTSTGTAWQTISKINSGSYLSGDSVLLNRGDTWNERLQFPSSGTIGSVIYIGAYGVGNKPLITGFQSLLGFTNVGNIWTATATNAAKQLNTVLVNGLIKAMARTPNTGWSTFTSNSGYTQITTPLSGTPNYTGSNVVTRTTHWIIDRNLIVSQSGGVLNFTPGMTYNTPISFGGNGFFIQNTPSDLDLAGEWTFDSTSKTFNVYATSLPTVLISTIDTLVWLKNKSFLTFDGLSFTGANKADFQLDTSGHITIQNCFINNSGSLGISGIKSVGCVIKKDSIQNSLSGAIYLRQVDAYTPTVNTCDSALVDSNYIKNTAVFPGMGMSGNGRYVGIYILGNATTVTRNVVDSSSYIAILFGGQNSLIKNNYVTNFCFNKDDGGGIYTVIGSYLPSTFSDGSIIRSNICVNGVGATPGTTGASFGSGIYLDNSTKSMTVDSNTIIKSFSASVDFNGANTINFLNNTIIDSLESGLKISNANPVSGLNIKRNITYNKSNFAGYYLFYFGFSDLTEKIDTNYYLRPSNEAGTKLLYNGTGYTLANWATTTGYDTHSFETPSNITSSTPQVYYNPTLNDSVINITGQHTDAKGNNYSGSVTLKPFSSAIMFPSTFVPPVILPVYKYTLPGKNFIGRNLSYKLISL